LTAKLIADVHRVGSSSAPHPAATAFANGDMEWVNMSPHDH
jgi:hypothetical protein